VTGASSLDPEVGIGGDPSGRSSAHGDDRSLGEIVGDISHDLTTLVKQELELARTELKEEAGKAGKGVGLLGGAGASGLLALIFLSGALAYLLDSWIPREAAFLAVGLLWAVAGAVLALSGRKAIRHMNPQLPETQQTLKEDVAWARAQKN
jgi:uncharacterized membrane protein YqjE